MSKLTTGTAQPPGRPTSPTLLGNPYVGPRPFTEEDAERFFGRNYEARELASLLIAERIILLYSPSGAGKTSLIQARLIATLRNRFRVLPIIRLNRSPASGEDRPVCSPNRYVESTLRCLGLTDPGPVKPTSPADSAMESVERSRPALADFLDARPRQNDKKSEVLIFDQFEEVFTLDPTDLSSLPKVF
jgi:Novel STAND NTPase 1